MKTKTVYLLHFSKPFSHAKHYLGSTNNLDARLEEHLSGHGAVLTREVANAGIGMVVVRVWKGGKKLERKLKNQKNAPRLCPVCNPKVEEQHAR